jgi:hypothetical protein
VYVLFVRGIDALPVAREDELMDVREVPETLRDCPGCGQECVEGANVICLGCQQERLMFRQIVRQMGLAREVIDSEFGDRA